MVTESRLLEPSETPAVDHKRRALFIALVAAALIVCGLLIAKRLGVSAAQESARAAAVEADDRNFCGKFGIGPDSARYPECRAALEEIRLRHQQRSADLFF